jgi:anti-sigma-K factor RskA
MTGPDIHTLAGAYALDAVDDLERVAFDRHIASCESCGDEIAELRATVARLADGSSATPPARLKANVLAAVAQTRQVPPGRIAPAARGVRQGWRRWAAAVAAAVVVAAGAGVGGYAISDQHAQTVQAQADQVNAILTAPDATVRTQAVQGGGQITVVWSPSLNEGVAALADMHALADGRVYQLWLVPPDGAGPPKSVSVMDPGVRSGTQILTGVDAAKSFAVSQEVAGGASTPTPSTITAVDL